MDVAPAPPAATVLMPTRTPTPKASRHAKSLEDTTDLATLVFFLSLSKVETDTFVAVTVESSEVAACIFRTFLMSDQAGVLLLIFLLLCRCVDGART